MLLTFPRLRQASKFNTTSCSHKVPTVERHRGPPHGPLLNGDYNVEGEMNDFTTEFIAFPALRCLCSSRVHLSRYGVSVSFRSDAPPSSPLSAYIDLAEGVVKMSLNEKHVYEERDTVPVDSKKDAFDVVVDSMPDTSLKERRLVRKLDLRILPIACMMYLFAYLDRSNLGNARLQGLPRDTLGGDFTGKKFDSVNSAFFFSYVHIVSGSRNSSGQAFPAPHMVGKAAIGWGICSTLMSTGFNEAGLIVCRVGLGVFKACFGPGIPVYFTLFYTKNEVGLCPAHWFGFAAISGAFGGLIAYGVQHAQLPFSDWRLLFIVDGISSMLSKTGGRYNILGDQRAVVITAASWCSDRLQSHGYFVCVASSIAGIGYLLLLTVADNAHVRYLATFCIVSGTYTTNGIVLALFAHNLGSETKRATAMEGPRYIKDFAVSCAVQFLGALCALVLTIYHHLENARRDRVEGKPTPDAHVDTSELADRAIGFRYVP
ncbi:hypothetical protein EVG20_g7482 [Dentipellis fragilis]|uniref:Major facilitator superfamily (MFS) profile domain-containing protein n=1 Tax=Dentipellis fragilis TaxID=205917 RepID=A0A4Y9YD29_9AGAM|nr:hypothetical protein EVG20_g7482 [Dentipellis fragilis]